MDVLLIVQCWALSGVAVLAAEIAGNVAKYNLDHDFRRWVDAPRPAPRGKPPAWFGPAVLTAAVAGWPVLLLLVLRAWSRKQTVLERITRRIEEREAKAASARRERAERAQLHRAQLLEGLAHVAQSQRRYLQEQSTLGTVPDMLILRSFAMQTAELHGLLAIVEKTEQLQEDAKR